MIKDIETIRTRILSDNLDPEDLAENEQVLREWEEGLIKNQAYIECQSNDITREITKKAKESYKDFAMILATNRTLTDAQRASLWAKQDACAFILSLTEKDAKGELDQINSAIKRAIAVT